jgi:acyl carrier protein
VPIGGPIANTQVYVLDGELAPVPIGVPGELYLGGIGLARGYRHRPGLTADRFCPNPYGPPGSRLYRTGDRARWRPDGSIEYLGRTDTQIKLRGYRIELGEIERVLGQQPGVREAVVLLRADDPGDPRLVGYVVPTGEPPSPATLRTVLQAQLPAYMVPQTWVVLETVPLTPNGKLDRGALPAPGGDRPTLEVGYVPPRTAIETTLVGIWQQVLGLDRVGIYDNFFELGGHSLLGFQLLNRLREDFSVQIPLQILFDRPTVAGLAAAILERQADEADAELVGRLLAQLDQLSEDDALRLLDAASPGEDALHHLLAIQTSDGSGGAEHGNGTPKGPADEAGGEGARGDGTPVAEGS